MRFRFSCYGLSLFVVLRLSAAVASAEVVDFNRDIRPILSAKCFQCHGPDEASREAELRLDRSEDDQGPFQQRDQEQVIVPGDLNASSLWHRITTDNEDEAMPPSDSGQEPLSEEQRELVKRWILAGAPYDEFWAFVPPKPQSAPAVGDTEWNLNRIDRFVMSQLLEQGGQKPQPQASKRTLIRRVTLDLTGLPPTLEEIRGFLADSSEDAYETLVERLLNSPSYGEHMARYWLDLVRFADTNGIHHDHYREMTPYRDWVIRSFNENLGFDKFITYQLAGDLFLQPTRNQLIASGFNRLHLVIDKGTAIPQESFTRNVIDRVTAVGTAFLGLTVGCAVCHDHKYDPITQRDFYQLYAFFNNIDSGPETPGRDPHAPFIRMPSATQQARINEFDKTVAAKTADAKALKARVDALKAENCQRAEALEAAELKWKSAREGLQALREEKKQFERGIPISLVMKERDEVRPTHILIRGAYDQPGEEVQRDTPSFLPPMSVEGKVKSRMDLARWLTAREHPLTARVTVNRFWQQIFGVGLVRTSEDFGVQGELPSHPQLLDDLTNTFVDSGWDVKSLVKQIVCSETYMQSSTATSRAFDTDSDNRMLARGSRFRLDAETIRDQVLAVSGLLNRTMYGRSVKPPQPPNLWKNVSMVSSSTYSFEPDSGEKIHRRSLYSFWKRAMPPPQMTIFDAPTRESCIARRERTNTPLQALVLMNEQQYFKAARHFAQTLLRDPNWTDRDRLSNAYESVTSQLPDPSEIEALEDGLRSLRETYTNDEASAEAMTSDLPEMTSRQRIELAAHTMLINALFNLDVTKTRQ